MKIKRLIILVFLSFLVQIAAGQQVKFGPIQKEGAKLLITDLVSHHTDQTVVMKAAAKIGASGRRTGFRLERFDAGFQSSLTVPLNPKLEGNDLKVEFCFESNGQIYLFASFNNKAIDKRFLYVQRVNSSSLNPEGSIMKVAELGYSKQQRLGSFQYTFSRDSSHILIYADHELRKNEPEKYSLYVMDQDMEPIWSREVTLPYTESKFVVQDFALDNDGNVFILGTKGEERGATKRKGKPTYIYHILGYRENGTDVEDYPIEVGDMFLTDMKIDVSPKKDIICAGLYSELGTFSIKGTYYLRIDRRTREIDKLSSKEFGIDFITLNFTRRQEMKTKKRAAKGKNVELWEYDLKELIPRADGGAVLMAEQYYVTVVCTTDPRTRITTCTTYYHYNDVIVVSISSSGDIEWATKVPKRQISTNDHGYYSSYVSMVTDGNLYLVYNDHRRNLEPLKKQGKLYNFSLRDKNGVVVVARIDSEGQVSRKALLSNAEISAITVPKLCRQINRNELLLYAKVWKGSQFGVVTF